MPRVMIIGTEGVGKTVFVAALAKHLESQPEEQVFLDPQSVITQQYIDEIWERLQRGENVSHTLRGTLPELHWKLRFDRGTPADVLMIDPAGHAVRELFGSNQDSKRPIDDHLQALLDACGKADIVLVLVDLQNYIGVSRRSHANANELVLKFAMDFLAASAKRRCALVFTKTDLYREELNEAGSWDAVAKRRIPKLFGSHLTNGVSVFGVAAINKTRVVHDNEQSYLAPVPGFQSEGFEDVVAWLQTNITQLQWHEDLRDIAVAVWGGVLWTTRGLAKVAAAIGVGLLWVAGIGLALMFALALWKWLNTPLPVNAPKPIATNATWYPVETNIWFWQSSDKDIVVKADVRNDGAAGYIGMKAIVPYGGYDYSKRVEDFFRAGESKTLSVQVDTGPNGTGNPDSKPTYELEAK